MQDLSFFMYVLGCFDKTFDSQKINSENYFCRYY